MRSLKIDDEVEVVNWKTLDKEDVNSDVKEFSGKVGKIVKVEKTGNFSNDREHYYVLDIDPYVSFFEPHLKLTILKKLGLFGKFFN